MRNKTEQEREINTQYCKENKKKWRPRRIELYPKKVLLEDKEKMMQQLSQLLFKMNQNFSAGGL